MQAMELLKKAPEVSFVVPVYNGEKFLGTCLDHILRQRVDKEIIIIIDGATDGTADVAAAYQAQHKCITVIDSPNQGSGYARNQGIRLARGRFIYFVDADDWLEVKDLDRYVKLADLYGADMVRGRILVDDEGTEILDPSYIAFPEVEGDNASIMPAFEFYNRAIEAWTPAAWANLYRRSFVVKNELFFTETNSVDDILFLVDAYSKDVEAKMLVVSEIFMRYRVHGENTSFNAQHLVNQMEIADEIMRRIRLLEGQEASDVRDKLLFAMRGTICNMFHYYFVSYLSCSDRVKEALHPYINVPMVEFYNAYAKDYIKRPIKVDFAQV